MKGMIIPMKKEFYDKPIYIITNYAIDFFLGSIYLGLCNILLLIYFTFVAASKNNLNLFLLFIFLIPLGPSLGALYSANARLMREKDITFSSYFWSSYKNNFISNLKPWIIELSSFTLLIVDYYRMLNSSLHIVFAVFLIIILLLTSYTLAINSRFKLKLKDLFIVSLYYMIKKFLITIIKLVVFVIVYLLCNNVSISTTLTFMPSIICFIFYYYDKSIFIELENKLPMYSSKHNTKHSVY